MPSIRFSSVTGRGLARRGAWRSIEASSALDAILVSKAGGVASAFVGISPNSAMTSPITNATTIVTMIPSMKIALSSPLRTESYHHELGYIQVTVTAHNLFPGAD